LPLRDGRRLRDGREKIDSRRALKGLLDRGDVVIFDGKGGSM
jgi:hypothetical protein